MQDWKKVYSSTQLATAAMVTGILNENGIAANTLNKQDSAFVFLGKVEVYVPQSDYDRAMELIKGIAIDPIETV